MGAPRYVVPINRDTQPQTKPTKYRLCPPPLTIMTISFPLPCISPLRLFALLTLFCCAISCSDPTPIGDDLINNDEFFNASVTDTFTIFAHVERTDSTLTAPGAAMNNFYALGALNDPYFGKTRADLYAEPYLSGSLTAADSLELDSIVLSLQYVPQTPYGDSTSTHRFYIHEVNESLNETALLYSDQSFSYDPVPLAVKAAKFSVYDSMLIKKYVPTYTIDDSTIQAHIEDLKVPAHLRIRLDDELGNRFLSRAGTSLSSISSFVSFFKGIMVRTDGTGNAMAYINMAGGYSKITLYYHRGATKGLLLTMPFGAGGALFNHHEHNYTATPTEITLNNAFPNAQETICLQGQNGTHLRFSMPTLPNLDSVAINKAELEFTVLPQDDSTFAAPPYISLTLYNNTTNKIHPNISSSGSKVEETINGQTVFKYKVNISLTTQKIIKGELDEYNFRIYTSQQSLRSDRVLLGGPNHPQYPMKLRVYYTYIE